VVFRKWGDRPHWESDAVTLGQDQHGRWLGVPAGTRMSRPGATLVTDDAMVALVPTQGCYFASFYSDRRGSLAQDWVRVYVDISTRPVWDGSTLRLVDLDLDVVQGRTGRVWVDDEDEFADHRVRFGYPSDVVRLAVRTCEEVRRAVQSGVPPFDGATSARWLEKVEVQDVPHER